MLGTGCGPLVSSMVSALIGWAFPDRCEGGSIPGLSGAYAGLGLASILSVTTLYPRYFDGVADEQQVAVSEQACRIGPFDVRVLMICVFLLMTALRGFVASGLEAATSLLLQAQYSWDTTTIGFAIGLCLLFSAPVKLIYNTFCNYLSTQSWIRLYTMIAMLAAMLLFSCWGGGSTTLFVADSLLFPTLFLADALAAGSVVASDNTLPADSWFSPNMLMLYRAILVFGVGRALAPPAARMIVAMGGRDAYAVLQLISTVLWLILYKLFEQLASWRSTGGQKEGKEDLRVPAATTAALTK